MKKRKIIPYNSKLKAFARALRNNSTKAEIILWLKLKGKQMYGYDFHRQKPIGNYILDFFCQELMLGIEVDGYSHELIEVYNKDLKKEADLKELGISVLRFSDNQVLRDMENVLRAIEYFIFKFEKKKHTPNPSQEGNKFDTMKRFLHKWGFLLFFIILTLSCNTPIKQNIIVKNYPNWLSDNDSSIVLLNIERFNTFDNFLNRIQEIHCNDSIPKIIIKSNTLLKNIYPIDFCNKGGIGILFKEKNIIEIHNDTLFKAEKKYKLDSLYQIMRKDYANNGKDSTYSDSPEKLMIYISYDKNGLKKLPNILDFITSVYDKIETNYDLKISLRERVIILPPPPIPTLYDNN